MRCTAVALVALCLIGCGSSATPTVNVAGTTTRSTEIAQIATLTAPTPTVVVPTVPSTPIATATPTTRIARVSLSEGTSGTIEGAYRVTISRAVVDGLGKVTINLRVDNLSPADLVFAPCSFLLRNVQSEDATPFACSQNASPSQGALIVAPGGSLPIIITFAVRPNVDLMWLRFIPTTPAGTMMFFGNS